MNKAIKKITTLVFASLTVAACVPVDQPVAQIKSEIPAISELQVLPTSLPVKTPQEFTESALTELPKGIPITFWHPWSGELANLAAEMVDEFNRSNVSEIVVNVEAHSDELVFIEDLNQTFLNGQPPEVIASPGYYLRFLEDKGFSLKDLQPFIELQDWGFSEDEAGSFYPVFWNADLFLGKRLGVPAYKTGQFIFYNLSWARELGFNQSPSTLESFNAQTCKAGLSYLVDSDPENNGTGGYVYSNNPDSFYSWLRAFGGGIDGADVPSEAFVNDGNFSSGYYLYDLFVNDCAWIGRQQQPYLYFANRQALAYSGKMEDILIQERVNTLNDAADLWSVITYPTISGASEFLVGGDSYAITTQDEQKSMAAWVFIRWMLQLENQVRFIKATGTIPLSDLSMEMLNEFKFIHPVWAAAVQYLPQAQEISELSDWGIVKKILADVSWQLIQYTTTRESIPQIIENAQNFFNELSQ